MHTYDVGKMKSPAGSGSINNSILVCNRSTPTYYEFAGKARFLWLLTESVALKIVNKRNECKCKL